MPAEFGEPFVGRSAEKKERSASPGVSGNDEAVHRDVEVELLDAGAELHRVDNPHGGIDAERCEILDVRRVVRLRTRSIAGTLW